VPVQAKWWIEVWDWTDKDEPPNPELMVSRCPDQALLLEALGTLNAKIPEDLYSPSAPFLSVRAAQQICPSRSLVAHVGTTPFCLVSTLKIYPRKSTLGSLPSEVCGENGSEDVLDKVRLITKDLKLG